MHISSNKEHRCPNTHQHQPYRDRLRTVRLFLPKLLMHSNLPLEASTRLSLPNFQRRIGTQLWAILLALNISLPLPNRSNLSSPRTKSHRDKDSRHL